MGGGAADAGPVLFAYDGSELAGHAITEARAQLGPGRDAVVVCVWQPVDLGFVAPEGRHLDATDAPEVRKLAEEVAAQGAELARAAGFDARSTAVEAVPTYKGIIGAAEEHGAKLIVFGSHCRHGLSGHLHGSVTNDVMKHCAYSVLVVRAPS